MIHGHPNDLATPSDHVSKGIITKFLYFVKHTRIYHLANCLSTWTDLVLSIMLSDGMYERSPILGIGNQIGDVYEIYFGSV